jgi:hypothetical protein
MGDDYRAHALEALPDRAEGQISRGGTVGTGHQLRLYNSLGRRLADFIPSALVTGMYSCGPTVYAFPHLGNW